MFRPPVLGHNDLCSHATSNVDIDDISFTLNSLFQITRARRSLNQLSRLRIHLVQEFHIIRIQSRKNVFETNIVALHDQIPHISRPSPSFLPSRLHSSRHRSALFFFFHFNIRKMMMQQRVNLFSADVKMSVSLVLNIFKYFSRIHFESAHFIHTKSSL